MHAHRPRKRFGQHFLHDAAVIAKMVSAIAPRAQDTLVEIGPGLGALTLPLLARVGRLHVVELDRDVIPRLQERCREAGELIVHSADALRFDFAALAPPRGRLRVVGNLPYNISTPLIFHLLEASHAIADMHFLLQKEVVDRLVAAPGSGEYGRLSVMVQYRCRTEALFRVGPGAFNPPPKVDSAYVRLVPLDTPPHPARDETLFAALVNQAFTQRRKTLRNAVRHLADADTIRAAGINPGARAETLGVKQFADLANLIAERHA
ncbi:16S rRNA (adenine(1518)-N(6)/adenine(1519)-N(6))-dimethyltransferase [Thioalkalivibrio denitrificans]|uniref:Ribosomal RNA small subunit methyltransferase A n=1 Tax=Thioalkalivibrio denitrificans TaxID=108003 RepID=A0A1V3NIR0_9GAMM|nr:16S rRNA (adenine(1518)-N(6)/adenine(1519)-N(6))-dimethyltransferase RsmA [Thioalkalivibrio denitrificans]OOG24768.1 16S rRNA (adenine(1518)-N(6)/adenine(1519)-N(6))-dimethyltransferase [Thioalkalivibrio denitrificans]